MMDSRVLVHATGLSVGYGRRPVLSGIDLELIRGASCFVLGPNGSGKSTLLKTLAGDLPPLAGTLSRTGGGSWRQAMGVVGPANRVAPSLPTTLREMVALGLAGTRSAFPRADVASALGTVGLGERARQPWSRSSSGERQRALIARALVRRPAVLLLDEPSSHLDPTAAAELFAELDGLRRDRALAVLVVSHDLALARRHADRVILCARGSARSGPAAELLNETALADCFGWSAA